MYDLNIHLPKGNQKESINLISEDLSMKGKALKDAYKYHQKQIERYNNGGNFMLFNQDLKPDDIKTLKNTISKDFHYHLTWLVNFRDQNIFSNVEAMHKAGINGIKFHSYVQSIDNKSIQSCIELAKYSSDLGLTILIDASYGTTKMYDFDNLKLAASIIDVIKKTPIIILHSGGARVLEALLLADSAKNVFLETSFTIPYYKSSTISDDIAFAYKKLGPERVIYGSDYPYVSFQESIRETNNFFKKYRFSDKEIETILNNNNEFFIC